MNPLLKRLLKISEHHNIPVIVYDAKSDKAGVFMGIEYFEDHFGEASYPDDSFDQEWNEDFEECDEEVNFLDGEGEQDFDELEQTNKELALYKSKREEKEREEIEKTLEEELLENPPPDPFEEDFLHTPEWHEVPEVPTEPTKQVAPPKEEPSYHPVMNSGGSLSWSDWAFTGNSFTPIPQKSVEIMNFEEAQESLPSEDGGEEPVFLEEPI